MATFNRAKASSRIRALAQRLDQPRPPRAADGKFTVHLEKGNRQCGDCQLCCKLLPVEEIGKQANTRCKHQKSALGCKIYPNRPHSCRIWSCGWLTDEGTIDLPRPDRSHYVVDVWPDTIYLNVPTPAGVNRMPQMALQVWVDPAYPDAWDEPRLKAYLDGKGMPVIIRYGNERGFVLFPPSMMGRDEWLRVESTPQPRQMLTGLHTDLTPGVR